jgi:hypothetical protein
MAAKVPVLAEQAVKRASLIEYSQVLIAVFRSPGIGELRISGSCATRADPIGYAVGRQSIIIPADITLARGCTCESVSIVGTQPAISPAVWRYPALVGTELAVSTIISFWGFVGQHEGLSCFSVSFIYIRAAIGEVLANTFGTQAQNSGNQIGFPATELAPGELLIQSVSVSP